MDCCCYDVGVAQPGLWPVDYRGDDCIVYTVKLKVGQNNPRLLVEPKKVMTIVLQHRATSTTGWSESDILYGQHPLI